MAVVGELGRGTDTVVYTVRRHGVEYALKLLDAPRTDTERMLRQFRREAALLAGVDHPGLPRIHEVGRHGDLPYLVMDLVDGMSLAQLQAAVGALPVPQVVALAVDVAGALAAVHRTGLVHRDIKPENIIVLPSGEARLIDFGLATRETGEDVELTVGTLGYASPEQAGTLNRSVDRRSDLYSLGVVLYAAVTSTLPFVTSDVGELLRMHAVVPPVDPATLVEGLGSGLTGLILKLLAKDPDDRYSSGEQLLADLALLQADPPIAGRAAEMDALRGRWQRAGEGHGGACLLHGSGGAGKSRLAAELSAVAVERGALVLHGKSSPVDVIPRAPLRAAVDAHLRAVATLPQHQRDEAYARLRTAAGSAAALLGALSPALGRLLPTTTLAEEDRHDQFLAAVVGFLAGLARDGGLLLVLDDVQWLDADSRRVLQELSGELPGVPLLVVATARDDEDSAAGTTAFESALGGAVDLRLSLSRLDDDAVAHLVATRLPGIDDAPQLARLLNVRGQGNPFVISEYLRALVDAGLLHPSWGGWLLDEGGLDALELPQDAIGLVLNRVRGLNADIRRLLTVAAVTGTRFRPELVADVCELERGYAAGLLVQAAGQALVSERDNGRYTFLHDRIREALLTELDGPTTTRLNQRIAEVLDRAGSLAHPETYALAQHYMLGDGTPPDRVVAACRAAARLALDDHAAGRAISFLTHAEAIGTHQDGDFLQLFGTALTRDGRHVEARARFERALTLESDPLRRADLYVLLAEAYRASWDITEALDAVERGLAEVGSPWPGNRLLLVLSTVLLIVAGALVAVTRIGAGRATGRTRARLARVCRLHDVGARVCIIGLQPTRMLLHSLRGLYPAVRLGPSPQYVRAYSGFGLTLGTMGLLRPAAAVFAPAGRAAEAADDPRLIAEVKHRTSAAAYLGGVDQGQTWEQALLTHGRWLDVGDYANALTTVCWELVTTGRTEEALAWFERGQARVLAKDRDDVHAFVNARSVALTVQGRFSEAAAETERVNALLAGHAGRSLRLSALGVELYLLAEQQDFGTRFEEVVAELRSFGLPPSRMIRPYRAYSVYEALGRISQVRSAPPEQRAARLADARAAAARLHTVAGTSFLTAYDVVVHADLAVLEGRPREARRLLATVEPVQRDAPVISYEVARVHARALRAGGLGEEALRQARLAMSIAAEQHWPHRERWVMAEFGVDVPTGGSRFAGRSAVALGENIYRQRLQALEELSRAAARVLDPDALARTALDEIIRILTAERAFLFLCADDAGPDGGRLVAYLGRDGAGNDIETPTAYSATLVERVRATGEPLVVAGTEDGAADLSKSVVLHGLRSIMAAPIQLEGRLMGVVYLDSRVAKGIFTPDDAGILTALTNHIATSFATARAAQLEVSVQAARQQRDVAETLRTALTQLSGEHDPQQVLTQLLDTAAQILPCDDAWLLVRGDAEVRLVGLRRDGADRPSRVLPAAADIEALMTATSPVLGDGSAAPPAVLALGTPGAWMAVPLSTRTAGVGALLLVSARPGVYDEAQVELGSALAVQGVTAYENASLFAQVRALATIDDLTGTANRRSFFDVAGHALAQTRRSGTPLAAIMLDIDHFKRVNDTHGHVVGDEVIRTVAARLSGRLRQSDTIGRYGGEEFAVLLAGADADAAARIAEELRTAVDATPVDTRAGSLPVTISLGVAELRPDDDVIALLAHADEALYRAKSDGRNRVRTA
jgi:diguanylate cyclase (GGDEF)-like protein